MVSAEYCKLMAHYNEWINNKIFSAAGQLTDEQRKEDKKAFFHSIHGTLNHIYYGDMAWLARFHGSEVPKPPEKNTLYFPDFTEFNKKRQLLDVEIKQWANNVTDDWLRQDFSFFSYFYKKQLTKPNWLFVSHFFNHQTHHRGQASTLFSQFGIDIGVTDLPWMGELD